MSFNFNGPSFRPMIQESQSMQNNGGGGNTGYFQRGKKKKEKEINVFDEAEDKDSFVPSSEEETEKPKDENLLDKLTEKAKDIVKKISETTKKPGQNPFISDDME